MIKKIVHATVGFLLGMVFGIVIPTTGIKILCVIQNVDFNPAHAIHFLFPYLLLSGAFFGFSIRYYSEGLYNRVLLITGINAANILMFVWFTSDYRENILYVMMWLYAGATVVIALLTTLSLMETNLVKVDSSGRRPTLVDDQTYD